MAQGIGVSDGGLSVADRMAFLWARQDLTWERAGEIEIAAAYASGDWAAMEYAEQKTAVGIDGWLDLVEVGALAAAALPEPGGTAFML